MELILPVTSDLAHTVTTPTYVNSAWVTSTAYAAGALVRYEIDSIWYDFRCNYAHTSSSTSLPSLIKKIRTKSHWTLLGPSSVVTGYSYTTNVRLSAFPAWVSGAAVLEEATVFDEADHHDYVATVAIAAGDNTLRPSQCLVSSNESLATRWVDLGAANAWAATDNSTSGYLQGLSAAGAVVNPSFTITFDEEAIIDRLAVIGLNNAAGMQINFYINGGLVLEDYVEHNRLYAPLALTTAARWTPTAVTVSANGTGPSGVSTEDAFSLRETSATSHHTLLHTLTVPCIEYTPFSFSVSAKGVIAGGTTRHLAIRFHAIDASGAVVESKYVHYTFNLSTGAVGEITASPHFFNTAQQIISLGSNWYRCHAFGSVPGTTVALVVQISVSKTTTAPSNTTANISSYVGSTASGLDICAPQLVTSWGYHDWYGRAGDDRMPQNYVWVVPEKIRGQTGHVDILIFAIDPLVSPSCGLVMSGKAEYIGESEWGVETSFLSFSRKERDDVYGTMTFLKRGSARTVRATGYLDPETREGDAIQQVVIDADGKPGLWDFNNAESEYDRLRVFGFCSAFSTVVQAASYEVVNLTVEGLVE